MITAAELKEKVLRKDEFILLDVREQHEFDARHIPDAAHIPLAQLAGRLGHLNRDAHVVVYCRSGGRSSRAADILRKAGFHRVSNLEGGILAWEKL